MNDQTYKVIAVSQQPAKPYTNSFGTTYYRDVRLADEQGNEHPKAISLGKKDANAHTVGLELFGHIEVDEGKPTDKFRNGNKQQAGFGGGGFAQTATGQSGFSGGSKPAYKDNSDGMRQGMCFNNAANYLNNSGDRTVMLSPQVWAQMVHDYANALYKLGDLGGETPNPKAPTQSPQTGQSKVDEDAEATSLYRSVAQSEGEQMPDDFLAPQGGF